MATRQFIEERIAKAKSNIENKENLIVKMNDRIANNISKIRKLGYEGEILDNPWNLDRTIENRDKIFDLMYSINNAKDSIKNATKVLPELNEKLQKYEADLQTIIEKENSRNIKVILDFLENWKLKVTEFYKDSLPSWVETLEKYHEEDNRFIDWYYHGEGRKHRKDKELVEKMERPRIKARRIHAQYSFLDRYVERKNSEYTINMELLKKDLDQEANMKYDFIIERTNRIVGQIEDASYLKIGAKGDLNGFIIGTRGKANVQTIGAGGYNIQCFHFRTLINEIKQ